VAEWVVDALVLGALYALAGILLLGGTVASSETMQLVRAFATGAPGSGGRR